MESIERKYYTIGEVAQLLGEAPSLIRFWEKEFPQLKPIKTAGGTRKYSTSDIELLQFIHHLVKEKGFTLEGAKEQLKNQRNLADQAAILHKLKSLRNFLVDLKNQL